MSRFTLRTKPPWSAHRTCVVVRPYIKRMQSEFDSSLNMEHSVAFLRSNGVAWFVVYDFPTLRPGVKICGAELSMLDLTRAIKSREPLDSGPTVCPKDILLEPACMSRHLPSENHNTHRQ